MKPRFTDGHKFRLPYEDRAATEKPNYLARRFKLYAALNATNQREVETKVKALQKRKAA